MVECTKHKAVNVNRKLNPMKKINRREFLSDTFSTAASFAVAGAFANLGQRLNLSPLNHRRLGSAELRPTEDLTTGLKLLKLPEGFSYRSFGWAGERMSDGHVTPVMHDGMGIIKSETTDDGEILTLCRNHEVNSNRNPIKLDGQSYDESAGAGCSNMLFNSTTGEWVKAWGTLSGTLRNCAGGVTPWGTWLTCEEIVEGPDYKKDGRNFAKSHGWVFEVGESIQKEPRPIRGMGRFVHEALAFDRKTGIVYQTEDKTSSGFYRFLPNVSENLFAGGELQIAEAIGQKNLRGGFEDGTEFDIRWHSIREPELANTRGTTDEAGVYKQGIAAGGSTFARLEGCWADEDYIYFDATTGGAKQAGQIWRYDPANLKLKLLFESPGKSVMNMPDNLCVCPEGGLVICEDNDYGANQQPHRMFALTQDGKLNSIAENNVVLEVSATRTIDYRDKEWAGTCFSPCGEWLFCNIQTPGITLAITGPWSDVLN